MEIELQYVYEGDLQPSVPTELAGLKLAGSDSFALTDTYFDDDRLALRRAGCVLRVRVDDSRPAALLAWKGPSKREGRRRKRHEVELPIPAVPTEHAELERLLREHGIDRLIRKAAGLDGDIELHEIGQLRNDRSRHTYVQGLHRLELTWDRLEFPTGPAETRVEVEVKSRHAHRYLEQADEELRRLLGADLRPVSRGKVRELCERLYPELLAA